MIRTAAGNALQLKERSTLQGICNALFILSKPGIVAAVTLSGFSAMVLAGRGLPEPRLAFSCLASLLLMAVGSALANSVLDRRMDQRMERLAPRSAALQRIGAGPALLAAAALTCGALTLASAELNSRVVLLLLIASSSYALCYTLVLKPFTHWAAVWGGIPGALPVLIGDAAVRSAPDGASLALFLILLLWQPPHFWLLSLAHLEEYRAAGVPVLPLVKGVRCTKASIILFALALIPASLLPWCVGPCSRGYALCAFALGAAFLLACRRYLNAGGDYRPLFRGSIGYLVALLSVICIDLSWGASLWPAP
jgi:heme o synthase